MPRSCCTTLFRTTVTCTEMTITRIILMKSFKRKLLQIQFEITWSLYLDQNDIRPCPSMFINALRQRKNICTRNKDQNPDYINDLRHFTIGIRRAYSCFKQALRLYAFFITLINTTYCMQNKNFENNFFFIFFVWSTLCHFLIFNCNKNSFIAWRLWSIQIISRIFLIHNV